MNFSKIGTYCVDSINLLIIPADLFVKSLACVTLNVL